MNQNFLWPTCRLSDPDLLRWHIMAFWKGCGYGWIIHEYQSSSHGIWVRHAAAIWEIQHWYSCRPHLSCHSCHFSPSCLPFTISRYQALRWQEFWRPQHGPQHRLSIHASNFEASERLEPTSNGEGCSRKKSKYVAISYKFLQWCEEHGGTQKKSEIGFLQLCYVTRPATSKNHRKTAVVLMLDTRLSRHIFRNAGNQSSSSSSDFSRNSGGCKRSWHPRYHAQCKNWPPRAWQKRHQKIVHTNIQFIQFHLEFVGGFLGSSGWHNSKRTPVRALWKLEAKRPIWNDDVFSWMNEL